MTQSKEEVISDLLQRDQPGITISVKTRNAITTLLNNSRDAIVQLYAGIIL